MYLYQKNNSFFAQVQDGLEELGKQELSKLGATNISTVYRGMYFTADMSTLFHINYHARIITRILAPLLQFTCHDPDVLYKKAKTIEWQDFFSHHHTFCVFANVSNSKINHSQYAALRVKDAIADYFREKCNARPSVDRHSPDVYISLYIENNKAILSLDMSAGSLHRRGYRQLSGDAPMQENIAAAIIEQIEWDGSVPLYDPMCGSGTLLAEALMYYCSIPAGKLRKHYGFEVLPEFDAQVWEEIKLKADKQIRPLPKGLILGSDISRDAISMTQKNLTCLPYGDMITVSVMDFQKIHEITNQLIVCNPPYGIRLRNNQDLGDFYKALGDFLKQRCKGSIAYIYVGNREMIKHVGLKSSFKIPLKNGGLDGRLVKYELY
ncbi:MAG: class I SAM-dependent RNA methyltransferase [Desulfobacterales bacterium]|nr:class I SAM-dependent RNA methyltransferase [Desulfobacterales bacterium]